MALTQWHWAHGLSKGNGPCRLHVVEDLVPDITTFQLRFERSCCSNTVRDCWLHMLLIAYHWIAQGSRQPGACLLSKHAFQSKRRLRNIKTQVQRPKGARHVLHHLLLCVR